jgi:hypothetical protein
MKCSEFYSKDDQVDVWKIMAPKEIWHKEADWIRLAEELANLFKLDYTIVAHNVPWVICLNKDSLYRNNQSVFSQNIFRIYRLPVGDPVV